MLEEKHKIILLVGPTGSGKTTLLKWSSDRLPKGFDFIFIGKPPEKPEEFVDTLIALRLLDKNSETYSIHDWLDWNQFAASAPIRSEIARANIKKRWDKKSKVIQQDNTNGITDGNTEAYISSASSV